MGSKNPSSKRDSRFVKDFNIFFILLLNAKSLNSILHFEKTSLKLLLLFFSHCNYQQYQLPLPKSNQQVVDQDTSLQIRNRAKTFHY